MQPRRVAGAEAGLRVALFTESLPPLTDGVARTYTWLAQALDEAGTDFRFVAPVQPGADAPWRGRVLHQASFAFPLYRYYRVALPEPIRLFRDLDAFRPDLVQVAAPTPLGWMGLAYARRRGIPCVSSYHTHFTDYFPYYKLGFLQAPGWALLRRFHNLSDRTFAPSPSCLARLKDHGFDRLALWERGLDAERFAPAFRSRDERARWAADEEGLLLYAGRLVADKDLRVLARALEVARAGGLRFRCVFAGDGPLKAELAARLPQDHFPGFVRGDALSRLYASADAFVFPSPHETFGNVVLEAMASGLPVLAVAAGGPLDLVDPGRNGLLTKPGDASAMAAAIGRLLKDAGLRQRLAAHGLLKASQYHWRQVHGRLQEAYRDVIRAAASTRAVTSARPASGRG